MRGEKRMNLCTFVGRVTKDPEIRYSQDSQMAIAKFVLAVDRNYKATEGEESADFFPCVAFDKRAEFAEKHLYKGIRIAINGKMRNNNYTNRNGEKVYGNSLYVDNIEFADGKREEGQELPAGTAGAGGQAAGARSAQGAGRTSGAGMSQSAGRTAAAGTGQEARAGVNQPAGQTGTGRTGNIQAANSAARTGTAGAMGQTAGNGAAGQTTRTGAAQGVGRAGGNGNAQAGTRSAAAGQRTAANRTAARGAASGAGAARGTAARGASAYGGGFMSIPDGIEDEGLPFH